MRWAAFHAVQESSVASLLHCDGFPSLKKKSQKLGNCVLDLGPDRKVFFGLIAKQGY